MDRSALEILASFTSCSSLLYKENLEKTALVSDLFNVFDRVLDSVLNRNKNLLTTISTLTDNLFSSEVEGAAVWNQIAKSSAIKLKGYLYKLQLKSLIKEPKNGNDIKMNLSILLEAQKTLPSLIETVDYLRSKEVNEIFQKEATGFLTRVFNKISLTNYDKMNKYCIDIRNQIIDYNKNIEELKSGYVQAYNEIGAIKDTTSEVEQLLAQKPTDKESKK